jgi:hypothetical protein
MPDRLQFQTRTGLRPAPTTETVNDIIITLDRIKQNVANLPATLAHLIALQTMVDLERQRIETFNSSRPALQHRASTQAVQS